MTQRTIRLELEAKTKTWATGKTPQIQIAYENVDFVKPDGTWVQMFLIPALTANNTVDTIRKTYYGMVQFNIYTKINKGTKEAEELAQELINLFPVIPKVGTVSIEQTGSILNTFVDSIWRVTPVRIHYRQEDTQ